MGTWTSIFLFVAGVAVSFLGAVSKYLFDKVQDHEKRIQKIEDVQGTKLDNISSELKDFKHDVASKLDALTNMIHKEKNQENVLNNTLTLLLKELEKRDERTN